MKTSSFLIIYLVLSFTLAGQARAMQNPLSIQGMHKALQTQIDQEVVNSLSKVKYFQLQDRPFRAEQDRMPIKQPDFFHVPDCLCQLSTRVI